jgi:hypothetical protein
MHAAHSFFYILIEELVKENENKKLEKSLKMWENFAMLSKTYYVSI